MKIIYISSMFNDESLENIFKEGKAPNFAANKYHQLLCKGLAMNNVSVEVYATIPVSRNNCKKRIVKIPDCIEKNLIKKYISIVNFGGIRQILLCIQTFFKVLIKKEKEIVLYDVLVMPSAFGAILAAKIRGFKCIGIVTDLPDFIHSESKVVKRFLNKKLVNCADGYILLTEQMKRMVNAKRKPYIVLEGHVDSNMQLVQHLPFDNTQKVVIYAGSLQKKYGVSNLVREFIRCHKVGEELHLYGNGDYEKELLDLTPKYNYIKYYGGCSNRVVVEAELRASLLVNPRTSEGEYTKYSFPSKVLEYMVSATPVLMAKLPGIPDEYDKYVYYFDDEYDEGLGSALREILDLDASTLEKKGKQAKEFVLENKSNVQQAKRIVDFLRLIVSESGNEDCF